MVQAIPADYAGVTPYLIFRDAARAIEFYKKAFNAVETVRLAAPGDRIGHAELKIGGGFIMLADESAESGARSVEDFGGSPVSLMFYTTDVDKSFAQAIAAGGKVERNVMDQFYGDRSGTLTDPFGYTWTIATHTEDLSGEEMDKRMRAMMASDNP